MRSLTIYAVILFYQMSCGSQKDLKSPDQSATVKAPAPAKTQNQDVLPQASAAPAHDHDDHDHEGDQTAVEPSPTVQVEPMPTTIVVNPSPTPKPSTNTDPNIVEFRIAAGTGANSWNTMDKMVMVKVGQTLRIINDDSVVHRLHTLGSPCGHGPNMAANGGVYNCVIAREYDPGMSPLYDHIAGRSAQFWVKAVK